MLGIYDFFIILEGKMMGEVVMFVFEKLVIIEFVVFIIIYFILKKYKYEGVIYEKDDDDK